MQKIEITREGKNILVAWPDGTKHRWVPTNEDIWHTLINAVADLLQKYCTPSEPVGLQYENGFDHMTIAWCAHRGYEAMRHDPVHDVWRWNRSGKCGWTYGHLRLMIDQITTEYKERTSG